MTNFDILTKMMDDSYAVPKENGNFILKETKGLLGDQIITVNIKNNIQCALYRFDTNASGNCLPFFNQNDDNGVKGLLKFCDYIMFCFCEGQTYVLMYELKRGNIDGYKEQLDATETFVDYIIESAKRVSSFPGNNFKFDPNTVKYRKILLKESYSNKEATKPKNINLEDEYIRINLNKQLHLRRLL